MRPAARREAAQWGCLVFGIPMLIVASPIITGWALWDDYRSGALRREFFRRWPARRAILVYSNSPNWQSYIEQNWLPTLGDKVVLLNWSERATWRRQEEVEHRVFRRFAGLQAFNPLAIIFTPRGRFATMRAWLRGIRRGDAMGMFFPRSDDPEVVRFYQAFRDYKHGKDELLQREEQRMFAALGMETPRRGS